MVVGEIHAPEKYNQQLTITRRGVGLGEIVSRRNWMALTTSEAQTTVEFVQEWMMSGDHEPDQWTHDFAAAIDARLMNPPAVAITEAIRKAKVEADKTYGIAWHHLEEVSRVELILAALTSAQVRK